MTSVEQQLAVEPSNDPLDGLVDSTDGARHQ